MTLRALLVVPVAALALSACGGSGEGATTTTSTSEAVASTDDRGPVTMRDVDDLGAKLGDAGWGDPGVGCGESVVDLAGYPKVVCIFPDEYAEPGQSGNAVSVMTFTEWDQADAYVAEYGDETTVRLVLGEFKQSRTMVYEDGSWKAKPSNDSPMSGTVEEAIADCKAG